MPTRAKSADWSAPAAVTVLRSDLLARLPWLAHGFSTRAGGVSTAYGARGELDLARNPDERAARREENRRRFLRVLVGPKLKGWNWRAVKQVHSDLVWRDPAPSKAGDALWTTEAGRLLTIRTADCVPILLVDVRLRAVAAVHAGWRGTVQRIAEKTIGELRARLGSQPADLRAAIGPSIRGCCYEVGEEVVAAFTAQFPYADELLRAAEPDPVRQRYPMLFMTGAPPGHQRDPRWNPNSQARLDLAEANRRQLLAAGLAAAAIEVLPYCTSCRADLFFSHRRDAGRTGRMAAAIGIRPAGQ